MDLELNGNTALVTASSSGLGLASARALAAEGVDVTICGRTPETLERARESIESETSASVLAVRTDLTEPEDVVDLVAETVETHGGLDHLVTSAGGPPSTTFAETDSSDWYQAFETLVMSVVWTIEQAAPHLRESAYGTITAIASRTVREAVDGLLLSNSVRRTVSGLIQTIAREFAPEIRANAVLPGTIETDRVREVIEAGVERGTYEGYDAGIETFADAVPLGRIGEPEELGSVVAFLSSPRASYVNGAELLVDGGKVRG